MKTIVTHVYPDLDAISSCWLIRRYLPGWEEADFVFVPAGTTYEGNDPDIHPDIIHVDTGLGRFDHHQTDEYISAAELVFEFLKKEKHVPTEDREGLERMVRHITEIDHFAEAYYPEPTSDRYEFGLSQVIDNLHIGTKSNHSTADCVLLILDSILSQFKSKLIAESEIKKGLVFQSKWGKTIAMETTNEDTLKLALKMGFSLVLRKDPELGNVRIKTLPKKELNLTPLYEKLHSADAKATWFLHSSKNMLLNASAKNPTMIPTSLALKRVIEIIKSI